jgi:hypothetical protein
LKVVTVNLVHDHFKASRAEKRGGLAVAATIDGVNSGKAQQTSISAEDRIERNILIQQIDVCLQAVCVGPNAERDRRIFWLHYRVGLAASAIAVLPEVGLGTKGVESTLLRLTREVRVRLCRYPQTTRDRTEGIQPAESL